MKTKQLLLIICLTLSFVFVSCSNDDDKITYEFSVNVTYKGEPLNNTNIRVYENLQNLRNKENPIFQGNTDENGLLEFKNINVPNELFVDAEKSDMCLSNRFSIKTRKSIQYKISPAPSYASSQPVLDIEIEKTVSIKLKNRTENHLLVYTDGVITNTIDKNEEIVFENFPIENPHRVEIKHLNNIISIDHITQGSCNEITTYELH